MQRPGAIGGSAFGIKFPSKRSLDGDERPRQRASRPAGPPTHSPFEASPLGSDCARQLLFALETSGVVVVSSTFSSPLAGPVCALLASGGYASRRPVGAICPTWHGAHAAAREAAALLPGATVLLADQARARGKGEIAAAGEDGGVVVAWGGERCDEAFGARQGGHFSREPDARQGGHFSREPDARQGGHFSREPDARQGGHFSREPDARQGGAFSRKPDAWQGGPFPQGPDARPGDSSASGPDERKARGSRWGADAGKGNAERIASSIASSAPPPPFPRPPPRAFAPATTCFPLEDFCRRRLRRDPLASRHAAVVLDLVDQRSLLGDALLGLLCVVLRRWGEGARGNGSGARGGGGGSVTGTGGEGGGNSPPPHPAASLPFRLVVCASPGDAPQLASYLRRSLGRARPAIPVLAPDELPHAVRASYLSQPCSDVAETAAETAAQLCAMLADDMQDRARERRDGPGAPSHAAAAAVAAYLPSRGACERAARTFRRIAEDRGLDGRVRALVAFPTAPSALRVALADWAGDGAGSDAGRGDASSSAGASSPASENGRGGAHRGDRSASYAPADRRNAPRFRASASPGAFPRLRIVFAAVDPSKDGEPARLAASGASYLIDGMLEGVTVAGPASGTVCAEARPVGAAEELRRAALVARRGPGRVYRLCTKAWFDENVLGASEGGKGGVGGDAIGDEEPSLSAAALRAPAPPPSTPASSLADLFLLLFSLGISNPIAFPWPRPPSGTEAVRALETLHALGALDGSARLRTPLGARLARLPLKDPCLSLLVLRGAKQGMAREAAWVAACAAVARDGTGGGSVFQWSAAGAGASRGDLGPERGRAPSVHPARARFSARFNPSEAPSAAFACAEGDFVAFLNVRRAWLAAGRSAAWAREAGLAPAALAAAERVHDATLEALEAAGVAGFGSETLLAPGLAPPAIPEAVERFGKVVAGGLFLRAARLDQDAQTAAGEPVYRALKETRAAEGFAGPSALGAGGTGGGSGRAALTLHPSSVFASPGVEAPNFVVFAVAERVDRGGDASEGGARKRDGGVDAAETYQMRCVQAIRPEWLSEVAPHVFRTRTGGT